MTGQCTPTGDFESRGFYKYKQMINMINNSSSAALQLEIFQQIYASTGGNSWTVPNNWFENDVNDVCSFDGVTCDLIDGHVTALNMSTFGLDGTIPSELALLSELKTLDLHYNYNLTGLIPSELGLLGDSMHFLDLCKTDISGSLPSELGLIRELKFMYVAYSHITGSIPSEFGSLVNLRHLWLFSNDFLTGLIPSELSNLTYLNQLMINENDSMSGSTLPTEFGNLASLQYLYLDDSNISGTIPSEFGLLGSILVFKIDNNMLTGKIPSELGMYSSVMRFELGNNSFTGNIPSQIRQLTQVTPDEPRKPRTSPSQSFRYSSKSQFSNSLSPTEKSNEILTTMLYDNEGVGYMFDIFAFRDISIYELDIHTSSQETYTVAIYTKIGSYLGASFDYQAWTEMTNIDILGKGPNMRTPIPSNAFSPISVPSESTRALYVTLVQSIGGLLCLNADDSERGRVYTRTDDIALLVGTGNDYLFGTEFGVRVFNGALRYINNISPFSGSSTHMPIITSTADPSYTPTIVHPVSLEWLSKSIHETGSYNNTMFLQYLEEFEMEFKLHLVTVTKDLSDNSSRRNNPRAKEAYFFPFSIIDVNSTFESYVKNEGKRNVAAGDSYCYEVHSKVKVMHDPLLFTSESINLVLALASSTFFYGSSHYGGEIPENVVTEIIVSLKGVKAKTMDSLKLFIFETSLVQFFHNEFLSESYDGKTPLFVENVTTKYQQITLDDNDEEPILEVRVLVSGAYLPSPEIDFGGVLTTTLLGDDDQLIKLINKKAEEFGETYFIGVNKISGRFHNDGQIITKGAVGILLSVGFLTVLFISFAVMSSSHLGHHSKKMETQMILNYQKKVQLSSSTSDSLQTVVSSRLQEQDESKHSINENQSDKCTDFTDDNDNMNSTALAQEETPSLLLKARKWISDRNKTKAIDSNKLNLMQTAMSSSEQDIKTCGDTAKGSSNVEYDKRSKQEEHNDYVCNSNNDGMHESEEEMGDEIKTGYTVYSPGKVETNFANNQFHNDHTVDTNDEVNARLQILNNDQSSVTESRTSGYSLFSIDRV